MYIHNIYTIFTYVYTKRIIYILYIVRIYTCYMSSKPRNKCVTLDFTT